MVAQPSADPPLYPVFHLYHIIYIRSHCLRRHFGASSLHAQAGSRAQELFVGDRHIERMATLSSTRNYAVRANVCGSATVEVHHRDIADIGRGLYWEQIFWLDFLGVRDKVAYRKNQVRRAYLERTMPRWGLASIDFAHGSSEGDALRQTSLTTSALIAWLFDCMRQFETAHAMCGEKFGTLVREMIDLSVFGLQCLVAAPSDHSVRRGYAYFTARHSPLAHDSSPLCITSTRMRAAANLCSDGWFTSMAT